MSGSSSSELRPAAPAPSVGQFGDASCAIQSTTPTLGRALFDALEARGARVTFGIPGDFVLPLFREARRRHPDRAPLPLFGLTHEPAVGFAADGAARLSRGLGVALVTWGAGALNMVNAVANAWAEKTPLVVISGAPGLAERRRPLLIHHQVKHLDSQTNIMAELTVDHAVLDDLEAAPDAIARVLDAALHHSRPVYLEVPRDLVDLPVRPVPAPRRQPFDPALAHTLAWKTTELLVTARRPLLLIDIEVARFDLEPLVADLVRRHGLPVATTLSGRGLLASQGMDPPTWLGGVGDPAVDALVTSSDLVLGLGVLRSDTNLAASDHLDSDRCVFIDAADSQVRFETHDHPLAHVLDVRDETFELPLRPFLEALDLILEARRPRFAARPITPPSPTTPPSLTAFSDDSPVHPDDVAGAIDALFLAHGPMPVVSDVGDCLFASAAITHCELIAPAYYATMGYAIPAALGAMAATGRRPLVLVGDGAFQMTGAELVAATPHGFDPIVVVFDNHGWEMVRQFDDLSPHHGLPPVDFAALAEALGGVGHRVHTRRELVDALLVAHAQRGRFHVLHVDLPPGATSSGLRAFTAAFNSARDRTDPDRAGTR